MAVWIKTMTTPTGLLKKTLFVFGLPVGPFRRELEMCISEWELVLKNSNKKKSSCKTLKDIVVLGDVKMLGLFI